MAKKEVRIPVNKLESIRKDKKITVPLKGAEGVEIQIRRTLPLNEMLEFVAEVVASCIDKEDGSYVPEVMQFSISTSVLTRYANFRLPTDISKQYDLVYNTDAVEQVLKHINQEQYEQIVFAIENRIEHELAMIHASTAAKVNELLERFNTVIEQSESMFDGLNDVDLTSLLSNLATVKDVDEEKLVGAVLKAQNVEQEVPNLDDKIVVLPKK